MRSDVDLGTVANDIAAELATLEPERKVNMVVEPGLTAHADPQLIRLMMQNLIANAWKFTGHTAVPVVDRNRRLTSSAPSSARRAR